MARCLVIPDPHLKIDVIERGLELARMQLADHIIILGDYFDDWGAIDEDYYKMVDYLKNLLRWNPNVFCLMGNHELSYIGYPCAGHNKNVKADIGPAIENDFRFWTCLAVDGVMYSHAGFTMNWLAQNKVMTLNDLRYKLGSRTGAEYLEQKVAPLERTKWDIFAQVGRARGGKDPAPSPLWADLTELIADPLPNIKQVVGHTPIKNIECIGKVWFTDVYSNGNPGDEYLFVVDGTPRVLSYSNREYERKW